MNVATVVTFDSDVVLTSSQMNRISEMTRAFVHSVVLVNEEIKTSETATTYFANTHQHDTDDGPCNTCNLIRNIDVYGN